MQMHDRHDGEFICIRETKYHSIGKVKH
ncbi:MAG: hypothetical protein RL693_1677, partial [Verrucomicrobiota bacterium]